MELCVKLSLSRLLYNSKSTYLAVPEHTVVALVEEYVHVRQWSSGPFRTIWQSIRPSRKRLSFDDPAQRDCILTRHLTAWNLLCPAPRVGALRDDACLTSDVCLSVAYIGPTSRTEIYLGHHFKGQKVKGQLAGAGALLWRPPAQLFENAKLFGVILQDNLSVVMHVNQLLGLDVGKRDFVRLSCLWFDADTAQQ